MTKVMVFVSANECWPKQPHEWHVRGGKVTMGRPGLGFNLPACQTHRTLFEQVRLGNVLFKELRNE